MSARTKGTCWAVAIALLAALLGASCAGAPARRAEAPDTSALALDPAIHDTAGRPFVPHGGPGAFGSYLAMDLPFAPVDRLRRTLERRLGAPLEHRGEAHVTVITPPEYDRFLRPHLRIEEIDRIALEAGIQGARFTVRCLGRGRAGIVREGRPVTAATYFLVIESEDLLAIRRAVARALAARGGAGFEAERFEPHVTVGFSHRDLHESDGVSKGPESCWAPVRESAAAGVAKSPQSTRRQRHSW